MVHGKGTHKITTTRLFRASVAQPKKYCRASFKAKKKKKGRVCAFIILSYFFPYFVKPKKVKVQGRIDYCNILKDESNMIFCYVEGLMIQLCYFFNTTSYRLTSMDNDSNK